MKKLVLFVFFFALMASFCVAGEKYPVRKIDVILPYGPGSGTDITMRALAPHFQKALGVPVVVQNVSGSGGLRGMEFAAKQPADGYTLFMCTPTHILAQIQNLSKVIFTESFDPLAGIVQGTTLITTGANGRFKTWQEMVAFAKDNPGEVTVAGVSPKGIDAISMRMLAKAAGIEVTFVPFASGAETNSAILGGHVDLNNDGPAESYEMIQSGDVIGLILATKDRLAKLPQVPTSIELGLDVTIGPWRNLCVPKGVGPERMKVLEAALKEAYESPEFQEWLKQMMLDQPRGWKSSEEMAQQWKDELEYLSKVFKELGL